MFCLTKMQCQTFLSAAAKRLELRRLCLSTTNINNRSSFFASTLCLSSESCLVNFSLTTSRSNSRCRVQPWILKAAPPDGAATLIVSLQLVYCLTTDTRVLMVWDFLVPPQPRTVARNGTYSGSLLRNLIIVSIAVTTMTLCSSDRSSSS